MTKKKNNNKFNNSFILLRGQVPYVLLNTFAEAHNSKFVYNTKKIRFSQFYVMYQIIADFLKCLNLLLLLNFFFMIFVSVELEIVREKYIYSLYFRRYISQNTTPKLKKVYF